MTCPHHDETACCTECPGHCVTDGLGFPHPCEAQGRTPLQRCRHCRRLVQRAEWVNDIAGCFFGCRSCQASAA